MDFDLSCARCGRVYHTSDNHIGKRLLCQNPSCGDTIHIARAGTSLPYGAQLEIPAKRSRQPLHKVKKALRVIPSRWRTHLVRMTFGLVVLSIGLLLLGSRLQANQKTTDLLNAGFSSQKTSGPISFSGSPSGSQGKHIAEQSGDPLIVASEALAPAEAKADPLLKHSSGQVSEPDIFNQIATISPMSGEVGTSRNRAKGRGILELKNGSGEDAAVAIIDANTRRKYMFAYVRASEHLALRQVRPGNYNVIFTTGHGWLSASKTFRWNPSYIQFGKEIDYSEVEEENGVRYQSHSITLNPVQDGNVPVINIDRAAFEQAAEE